MAVVRLWVHGLEQAQQQVLALQIAERELLAHAQTRELVPRPVP